MYLNETRAQREKRLKMPPAVQHGPPLNFDAMDFGHDPQPVTVARCAGEDCRTILRSTNPSRFCSVCERRVQAWLIEVGEDYEGRAKTAARRARRAGD